MKPIVIATLKMNVLMSKSLSTNGHIYIGLKASLSHLAEKLGAQWCVINRKWRIESSHPNLPMLIQLSGFDSIEPIKGRVAVDHTKSIHRFNSLMK